MAVYSERTVVQLLKDIDHLEARLDDAKAHSERQENIIGIQLRLRDDLQTRLKLADAVCEAFGKYRPYMCQLQFPVEMGHSLTEAHDAYLASKEKDDG